MSDITRRDLLKTALVATVAASTLRAAQASSESHDHPPHDSPHNRKWVECKTRFDHLDGQHVTYADHNRDRQKQSYQLDEFYVYQLSVGHVTVEAVLLDTEFCLGSREGERIIEPALSFVPEYNFGGEERYYMPKIWPISTNLFVRRKPHPYNHETWGEDFLGWPIVRALIRPLTSAEEMVLKDCLAEDNAYLARVYRSSEPIPWRKSEWSWSPPAAFDHTGLKRLEATA